MPDYPIVEPPAVVELIEGFVDDEHRDNARYDNRTLLDDSGVFSLHRAAAQIYAMGYRDGEMAQSARDRGDRRRERERSTEAAADA